MRKIALHIGSHAFTATLDDTPAAAAFAQLLPLNVEMEELNGNEKYHLLDGNLPTDAQAYSEIATGDIMLFQGNILVIFYKTHRSSYHYTRLGIIDDPERLEAAVGNGSVRVLVEPID